MNGKSITGFFLVACLAANLLTGCGQRGDLYLPAEPDTEPEPEPVPPVPPATEPLGPGPGAPGVPGPLDPTVPVPLGSIPLEPEPAEAPLEPEESVETVSE